MTLHENLANYAHESWNSWMKYLFTKGTHNSDGSFTIHPEFVTRWKRQIQTAYNELPEEEKRSDQDEADNIITIIKNKL